MIATDKYIDLLKQLIACPSFSREEDKTAAVLCAFLEQEKITFRRFKNNIWAVNLYFDPDKPSILLNSHHDTVKPNPGYSRDPFSPDIRGGRLYGLGSNDAGASLVCLLAAFQYLYAQSNLTYNLIWAATAEEEISGSNGMEALFPLLPTIDFAIIGEPTTMKMAIAEKGLIVLDCVTKGKAGHAARGEGENAIYKAMKDIAWFQNYRFPRNSEFLGDIKMSVTMIAAGEQHNIVPDLCRFTVDIRTTDVYTHEEVLSIISKHVEAGIVARSTRLKPSSIPKNHPLVQAGFSLGLKAYGSPTLSDQALVPTPSLKIGPGDSARSHASNEFVYINEIESGIKLYIQLINKLV